MTYELINGYLNLDGGTREKYVPDGDPDQVKAKELRDFGLDKLWDADYDADWHMKYERANDIGGGIALATMLLLFVIEYYYLIHLDYPLYEVIRYYIKAM